MGSNLVTFLSDFGLADYYVAAMKGVVYSIDEEITVVDLTHEISPQNVIQGAYVWWGAVERFPVGAVHVGVVDPGVGTSRRILLAMTERGYFICPDNGLITMIRKHARRFDCFEITERSLFGRDISRTFHGRDIFSPLAANISRLTRLSGGPVDPLKIGRSCEPLLLDEFDTEFTGNELRGQVLFPDRFGNLVTNITMKELWSWADGDEVEIVVNGVSVTCLVDTYAQGAACELFGITGSMGHLEISRADDSAHRFLDLEWYPLPLTIIRHNLVNRDTPTERGADDA